MEKYTETELVKIASEKITEALAGTKFSEYSEKIIYDYTMYLKLIQKYNIITSDNLDLFLIRSVTKGDDNSYASWAMGNLVLCDRFFDPAERNDEDRRNVLFHELTHAIVGRLVHQDQMPNFCNFELGVEEELTQEQVEELTNRAIGYFDNNPYYSNLRRIINSANTSINEVTTQYIAEDLTAKSYNKSKKEMAPFDSKIFVATDEIKSDFSTYPEYEQLFLDFLRTINGFGKIEDNDELFYKWFKMLTDGSIWNQIIGTYKEKGKIYELYEFLVTFAYLKSAKESSFGKDVEFTGDKEKLTNNIIAMDKKLKAMRNLDEEKEYETIEIPEPGLKF